MLSFHLVTFSLELLNFLNGFHTFFSNLVTSSHLHTSLSFSFSPSTCTLPTKIPSLSYISTLLLPTHTLKQQRFHTSAKLSTNIFISLSLLAISTASFTYIKFDRDHFHHFHSSLQYGVEFLWISTPMKGGTNTSSKHALTFSAVPPFHLLPSCLLSHLPITHSLALQRRLGKRDLLSYCSINHWVHSCC